MTDNPSLSAAEVTAAIRSRILDGGFAPGQRLVEADLCEMFHSGRRQVREALAALTHEALVEQIANKGARVRVVEPEEALHLAEARFILERACLEHAAARMGETDVAELRALAGDLEGSAAAGDPAGYARHSERLRRFHVERAAQPVMQELLERLQARNMRYRNRIGSQPGWLKVSLPLRLRIVEALCRRDAEGAVQALTRHHEAWKAALARLSGSS
ncbi:GntR family transcriptional regulator [Paracoccus aminovorans]|uniref:GntR family transcriptional regulator n=1 Tax=Paracoccus aminovorans TaxID=34004 RepID=UPI000780AC17|nr:GntR family transcriptional regulator [Paracoccus aminovorans]MDQ7777024.1 GntR family transcriptional regulator [Paracoccus aminovorans]